MAVMPEKQLLDRKPNLMVCSSWGAAGQNPRQRRGRQNRASFYEFAAQHAHRLEGMTSR
jgi:hypothetical protein